jgi:RNA polymerase sigma-70 factor (ECF subfamily)
MIVSDIKYDEKKLLFLLSQDSSYAFQLIYDNHKNNIYRVAINALKSPLLAQEVVQDVFLKLWFERKNLLEIKSLENWLFIVAKNHMINQLKKISREWQQFSEYSEQQKVALEEDIEYSLDKKVYYKLHSKAVSTLTNHQKNVYELIKFEKLTHLQVANKLKISPLTVKKHMSRALTGIRKFLKESGFKIFF